MLWGLRPIQPRAAYGLAHDLLQRQIHSGLLLPEERLPAERQLSDQFGISRVTLREALRALEANEYITVRRGAQGGAFVNDADRLSQLARRRITRAPAQAMRVVEFLAVNQLAAVRFAVERRGLAELKRMRQAVEMMAAARTGPERRQAEALFILAVGDAAHNALLSRAISDGLAEQFLPFEDAARSDLVEASTAAFRAILDGLEVESKDDSERAMINLNAVLWERLRRITRKVA